jgi:hypothetical protein
MKFHFNTRGKDLPNIIKVFGKWYSLKLSMLRSKQQIKTKQSMMLSGLPWLPVDDRRLRKAIKMSDYDMSQEMGRTAGACKARFKKLAR